MRDIAEDLRFEDSAQSYGQFRDAIALEQQGKDYDEVKRDVAKQAHIIAELDNLQPQVHRWIDRGAVMSCEGAGHPYHRAFKRM